MYEVILVCLLVVMVEGVWRFWESTWVEQAMWGCEGEEEGTAMKRKPGIKDF